MKRSILMLIIVLLTGGLFPLAQRPKPLAAKILTNSQINSGFLKSINDTSLQLTPSRISLTNTAGLNIPDATYAYSNIDQIKIWKRGSVGRGLAIGAIAGTCVGVIAGLISYQKPDPNTLLFLDFGPGFSAALGGIIGVLPGALIGGIAGTKKWKFHINRNQSNFSDMRKTILEKASGISKNKNRQL